MKKLRLLVLSLLIGVISFFSCKKSQPNYIMIATIGTNTYNLSPCTSSYDDVSHLTILGGPPTYTAPEYPYIELDIRNWNGTIGKTNIDSIIVTAAYFPNQMYNVGAAYGTITISSVSPSTISGTFSFTCTDSTKITNGRFTAERNY